MIITHEGDLRYEDKYVYVPDIDGQELIDRLNILVGHEMRWDGLFSVWDRNPHELVYEGLITKLAWGMSIPDFDTEGVFIRVIIYTCGFSLIPYAYYRRDNPPIGDWKDGGYGKWFIDNIATHYKTVCDRILKASHAELSRD